MQKYYYYVVFSNGQHTEHDNAGDEICLDAPITTLEQINELAENAMDSLRWNMCLVVNYILLRVEDLAVEVEFNKGE